jgi:hypothetical protein
MRKTYASGWDVVDEVDGESDNIIITRRSRRRLEIGGVTPWTFEIGLDPRSKTFDDSFLIESGAMVCFSSRCVRMQERTFSSIFFISRV